MIKYFSIVIHIVFVTIVMLSTVGAEEKHYGDLQGIVVSNYDGDTMTVDLPDYIAIFGHHIPVRINGIDTPELHGTTGDLHNKAVEAKNLVALLCPPGSPIILKNVARDKYFRIDATVFCKDVDVGKKLIDAGLAHQYDGGTKAPW